MATASVAGSSGASYDIPNSEKSRTTWDHLYHVSAEDLQRVRDSKPWAQDGGKAHPKYFTRVMCSASATVKMVSFD